MRVALLFLVTLFFFLPVQAQVIGGPEQKSSKGSFYVSVDDGARIYVNGVEKFAAKGGESRSPECELKTGDRILIHLREDGGGKRFMVVFASTDGQMVVNFRHRDFKIVPEIEVTDFTLDQFKGWNKFAKEEKHREALPVKNSSEWLWGDLDKCIIAGVITPQMFARRSR